MRIRHQDHVRSTAVAPPGISIIVCTRNRAPRLNACLDHIEASGRACGRPWELVVVDNGSTDATRETVIAWSEASGCPVRLVHQAKRGLSAARNKGVAEARAPILAFVDDDCLVDPGWMAAMVHAHEAPSRPDLVGGRVDLHDEHDAAMSIRPFDGTCDVTDLSILRGRLIGCNFSLRADALRSIGPFDESLGAGTAVQSAEDFDLFYRMLRAGMRLRYVSSARLRHAHGRRDPAELAALRRGYERGIGAFYAKHILRGDVAMLRTLYWDVRGRGSLAASRDVLAGAWCRLRGS